MSQVKIKINGQYIEPYYFKNRLCWYKYNSPVYWDIEDLKTLLPDVLMQVAANENGINSITIES